MEEYEIINYERAKYLYELGCSIMIGDIENSLMNASIANLKILNKSLDECIKTHKNYYPDDDIKFYLHKSWRNSVSF